MDSGLQSITLSAPIKRSKNGPVYRNPFDDKDEVDDFYDNLWNDLQKKFKAVHKNLSEEFVSDITSYIKSYEFTDQSIPALALLTGVNVADHNNLFKFVKNEVKSLTKHPIVFIRSCHDTTVKPVIERMVQSFLTSDTNEPERDSDGTDSNDSEDDEKVTTKMRKWKCTLTRLQLWYQSKKVNEDDHSPLIIVLPDLESFSRKILNDLFSNLSVYKDRLPFILLLGIASDLNALHQRVALSVLQNYDVVIFKTKPTLEFLDLVLEKIFLTAECPFQLHGQILDQLIEAFTFYNFSVEFFVRGIQVCLINHFLNARVNILCCPIDELENVVKSLDTEHLNELLTLPSVGLLNTLRKNEKQPVLNKKNIKSHLISYMKELHQRLTRFHVAVRCFFVIVKSVPNDVFGKKLRNIYCEAMKTNITKSKAFKECMNYLKFLSVESVLENINFIKKLLLDYEDDSIIAEKLKTLVRFCDSIGSVIKEVDNKFSSLRKRKLYSNMMNSSPTKSPRKNRSSILESSVHEESCSFTLNIECSTGDEKSLVGQDLNNEMNSLSIGKSSPNSSFKQEEIGSPADISSLKDDISSLNIRSSSRELLFLQEEPTTPEKALCTSNIRSSSVRKLFNGSTTLGDSSNELNSHKLMQNGCHERMSPGKELVTMSSRSSLRKIPYTSTHMLANHSIKVANSSTSKLLTGTQSSPHKQINGTISSGKELSLVSSLPIRSSPRKSAPPKQSPSELNTRMDVQNSLHELSSSVCEELPRVSTQHVRSSPHKSSNQSAHDVDVIRAAPNQSSNGFSTPKNMSSSACNTPSSRGELTKMLRQNANQKKPLSAFERQKSDLVEFLSTDFFGELLECPTMYPFHEVLLYKDAEYVKRHYTSVNQRREIEKALLNPHDYLKCKCCKLKTQEDFPDTMPDLCISYRLFLEHTDENIDLSTWLLSFDSKVSGTESEEVSLEVYNRFKQTIKELQLMGFIEPHKTKVDWVKNVNAVRNLKS